MCSASSPHSQVMVGTIPPHRTGSDFSPKSTGAILDMMVTFLSCKLEIDWLNDGIQLIYPGPKMGIDRV